MTIVGNELQMKCEVNVKNTRQCFMWYMHQDNLSIVGVYLLVLRSIVERMLNLLLQILL
jgi:hypothetical protein